MKELRELAIGIILLILLTLFMVRNGHSAEFPAYRTIALSDLAQHADSYNSTEVRVKGKIKDISAYTGVYGGQYIGLALNDDITVYFYAKTGVEPLSVGDTVVVDGIFHKFALFGGQSHDFFITTHHLELIK